MSRINSDAKEAAVEAIKVHGTMKAGAEAAGVSVRTLNEEMRRSAIFKRRIIEAREEGKRNVADNAIDRIKEYAFNPPLKTDRNVLTAAIALANAYEPGFRGTTTVQGRIEHDVRVITAVPRPKYDELPKVEVLDKLENKRYNIDKEKLKLLNQGASKEKINSVEEIIEGEVVNEDRN